MQHYEVIEELGRGNFGTVDLVRAKEDDEMLVVKKIDLKGLKPEERKASFLESQVLRKMSHPFIVGYEDSFLEHNKLHIVMEYCDGGDLSEVIEAASSNDEPFDEDTILDWFVQMALALQHIHHKKILHRDLKTGNVFIKNGPDGPILKLGDFGISKVLNSDTEFAKTAIGTPFYLSPEICEGKRYGRKSDIWSLGCILYELCALQHAFNGRNLPNLVMKILRGVYPPIPRRYSKDLRGLIASMLKQNPRRRPRIDDVLELPFISARVDALLDAAGPAFGEELYEEEESDARAGGGGGSAAGSAGRAQTRPPEEPAEGGDDDKPKSRRRMTAWFNELDEQANQIYDELRAERPSDAEPPKKPPRKTEAEVRAEKQKKLEAEARARKGARGRDPKPAERRQKSRGRPSGDSSSSSRSRSKGAGGRRYSGSGRSSPSRKPTRTPVKPRVTPSSSSAAQRARRAKSPGSALSRGKSPSARGGGGGRGAQMGGTKAIDVSHVRSVVASGHSADERRKAEEFKQKRAAMRRQQEEEARRRLAEHKKGLKKIRSRFVRSEVASQKGAGGGGGAAAGASGPTPEIFLPDAPSKKREALPSGAKKAPSLDVTLSRRYDATGGAAGAKGGAKGGAAGGGRAGKKKMRGPPTMQRINSGIRSFLQEQRRKMMEEKKKSLRVEVVLSGKPNPYELQRQAAARAEQVRAAQELISESEIEDIAEDDEEDGSSDDDDDDEEEAGGEGKKKATEEKQARLSQQIESTRKLCEDILGPDLFLKVYRLLKNMGEDADGSEVDRQLNAMLTAPQKRAILHVNRLLICEELFYGGV